MAYHPNLTDEQRANLRKLAAYLRTLPADYPDFEMKTYSADGSYPEEVSCGTAACALGHGPMAGIRPRKHDSWGCYATKFVRSEAAIEWYWCFSGIWSSVDNTVHGAAARIEMMLSEGIPDNVDDQSWGEAPLSYAVAA